MAEEFLKIDADESTPLRDLVFRTLRRAILMDHLPPGTRLLEVQLSEEMGVSRTPVREAIRMLEHEGLVTMYPRRGAVVAKITRKGMKDVLEVRAALDELAVGLACERATEEQIALIESRENEFEESMRGGDLTGIARADAYFHSTIVEAADNEKLQQISVNLAEQMHRYRYETLKDVAVHRTLIEEHRGILNALKSRNTEDAKIRARGHIERQVELFMKKIKE